MINNSKFIERLKKVMDYHQLSAAAFADEIDVQRSSISHLLSGRNKPSLDFVLKVLSKFDTVDLYWLMNGKGNFPKKEISKTATPAVRSVSPENNTKSKASLSDKEIDRIIIFYKDGTFENYMQ